MATTQITIAAFQTACAECGDAIVAGNWGTAKQKYAVAEAINAGLLKSSAEGSSRMERRDSLKALREAIDAAQSASTSNRTNWTRGKAIF